MNTRNVIPRIVFTITTSFCVNVYTNESTYPSTFVVNGSRQAVLNQEQSFSHLPTQSIPTIVYTGVLRRLTDNLNNQSGRRLSQSRQTPSKRRYANGAICTIRVIFRSIFTRLLTAPALGSWLSICQSL